MSHSKSFFRFLALAALFPFLSGISNGGQIVEGDLGDAMVTQNAVNNLFYHNNQNLEVGPLYNENGSYDVGTMVECFPLPYLAPGQQIVSASISFYLEQMNSTPPCNVQLYGLNRVSTTNPLPLVTDWYDGTNDTANVLLAPLFVTPKSAVNQAYTFSGSKLVSFVQQQYANSAFTGLDLTTSRYVFFRLSPDSGGQGVPNFQNYQFASSRHGTRTYHPTLTLTISNGLTNVAGRLQFAFTLPQNSITSAGVYNTSTGALIRTLWNNVQYAQGSNYGVWDGKDDSGATVPTGSNYQIKLIYHNVQYIWQGVVGNTSASATGSQTYRSLINMQDMSIAGGKAYYSVGYNEGQDPFHYFVVGTPQAPKQIQSNPYSFFNDPYSSIEYVTSDGTRSYWAKGIGGLSPTANTYVIAINQSDSSFYNFSKGTVPTGPNQNYSSCIDYDSTPNQPNSATGLAVQTASPTSGDLFVSHGNLNVVRVFDKITGASLGSFTVQNPGHLSITKNGDVWVLANGTNPVAQRYTFANGKATLKATITGLVAPAGICVSADDSLVVIADSGSSQQIKAFNNSTGAALWTYGVLGGMPVNSPAVTTSSFDFSTQTFVAFQSDNTFWVGDQGSGRGLHFSISGNTLLYIEQIAYNAVSYQATVDLTDATRVFNRFMEYSVNYSIPLGGTNGSWTMTRNWGYGLPNDSTHAYLSNATNIGDNDGFTSVVTLSNGHTYALLTNFATNRVDLAELPASGPARLTGNVYTSTSRLYPDGTLRFNLVNNGVVSFYSQALTGFDAQNNPKWGAPTMIATTSPGTNGPMTWVAFPERTEVTAGGIVVDFDGNEADQGYHLGGVPLFGTNWRWLACPSTGTTYTGWFPQDGRFDSGNGVQYAGNVAMALGRNIVYGYHGEFWKDNQASQWVNFLDNGLMVGRFGTLGINVSGDTAVAGFTGNSFTPTLVQAPDGNTYLYHNEECAHGGTVRWLISGWNAITELNATTAVGGSTTLTPSTGGPSVILTSPTQGAAFLNGGNVTVSAQAAGSGAGIASVQFLDGATSLGSVSTAPYTLNASGLAPGSHTITAKAKDTNGASTTSAAVTITVGADAANTPPPAPTSLGVSGATNQSVSMNWVQPTWAGNSSTIGQIISIQFNNTNDVYALKSTDVAGAPGYATSHFNVIPPNYSNGNTYMNLVTSAGNTISNVGMNLAVEGRVDNNSGQTMPGTARDVFSGECHTYNTDPAITISNVPFALYDLVVYTVPENVTTSGLSKGSVTSYVTVTTGAGTSNINQSFTTPQTGYAVTTVPFGTSVSTTNQNTIVFQGMTSQSFILQGQAVESVQIVERPYNQGTPTSHQIERALASNGIYTLSGTASGTAVNFTDSGSFLPATAYLYRVRAVNSFGNSGYSNVITVVTPSVAQLSNFSSWLAHYYTTTQMAQSTVSGANADPYGSGVPNLLAYALQLNPATAQPSDVPHAVVNNGHLTLTYLVPSSVTDVTYTVEVSPDLVNWSSGSSYTQVISAVTGPNGVTYTIQDLATTAANKRFMRLRVTQN